LGDLPFFSGLLLFFGSSLFGSFLTGIFRHY
jgi:hypothetical protein